MHGRCKADGWALFPHDADIGVRGYGETPAQAFANAARALNAAVTPLEGIEAQEQVAVQCEASPLEVLFFDWLNAVIFEMATRNMVFGRFEVEIEGNRLTARLSGEPVDIARHAPAVEAKGATFTGLSVRQEEGGCWVAECIVDV